MRRPRPVFLPLSPFLSHFSALFCSSQITISPLFNRFRTLSPKHAGRVVSPSAPPSSLAPSPHPPKPFKMIFFADLHHLTPIESYSYEKQGEGGTPPVFTDHGTRITGHAPRTIHCAPPTLHSLASPLFSHLLQTPRFISFAFTSFQKTGGGGYSTNKNHPPSRRRSSVFSLPTAHYSLSCADHGAQATPHGSRTTHCSLSTTHFLALFTAPRSRYPEYLP